MQQLVHYITNKTYKPLLVRYLSKTRPYTYKGIRLQVPPDVFHPGFFFSTKLLLRYISGIELAGKKLLELGAGSGLLSIYAAKKGAQVTAVDISQAALSSLRQNALANAVHLDIIHSDLFSSIKEKSFDLILINPPYYKKNPLTEADHAWYCGEHGEYFEKLFQNLNQYYMDHAQPDTEIVMVLSEACDITLIVEKAGRYEFALESFFSKKNIFEWNYLFRVTYKQSIV